MPENASPIVGLCTFYVSTLCMSIFDPCIALYGLLSGC